MYIRVYQNIELFYVLERTTVYSFQTNRFGFDQFGILPMQNKIRVFHLYATVRDPEENKPM
jgi:hypothetical protein